MDSVLIWDDERVVGIVVVQRLLVVGRTCELGLQDGPQQPNLRGAQALFGERYNLRMCREVVETHP